MFVNNQRTNSFVESAFGATKGVRAQFWTLTKPRSVYDAAEPAQAPADGMW